MLRRQCAGFRLQCCIGDRAIHQAERRSTVSRQEFTGCQHLEGLFAGHIAAERDHRRGTEKPDTHAIHTKARRLGCQGHIAGGDNNL